MASIITHEIDAGVRGVILTIHGGSLYIDGEEVFDPFTVWAADPKTVVTLVSGDGSPIECEGFEATTSDGQPACTRSFGGRHGGWQILDVDHCGAVVEIYIAFHDATLDWSWLRPGG